MSRPDEIKTSVAEKDMTPEAMEVINLAKQIRQTVDKEEKLKLANLFYKKLLDIVTPKDGIRSGTSDQTILNVLNGEDDMLAVGSGTTGQRIYFTTEKKHTMVSGLAWELNLTDF